MTITLGIRDLLAAVLVAVVFGVCLWWPTDGLPLPFVPSGPYEVVIAHDSDLMDNLPQGQRDIVSSLVVREKIEAAGHSLQILDSEQLPTDWGVLANQAPCVGRRPLSGGTITVDPLPAEPASLYSLLGVQ